MFGCLWPKVGRLFQIGRKVSIRIKQFLFLYLILPEGREKMTKWDWNSCLEKQTPYLENIPRKANPSEFRVNLYSTKYMENYLLSRSPRRLMISKTNDNESFWISKYPPFCSYFAWQNNNNNSSKQDQF